MSIVQVAVVIRTKNRPSLLSRALRSVLDQTMTDLVAVVVNDGGDRAGVDDAVAAAADDRILVVHHEHSLGRSVAANAGIEAVDSACWVLHDDDDTWAPDFLAATTEHLAQHPEHAAVAVPVVVIYERVEPDHSITEMRRDRMFGPREVSLIELSLHNYVTTNSLLVRREVYDTIGGFSTELPVLEDWDFNLRLASRYAVGFVQSEALAFWHHREDSVGDEGNSVSQVADAHTSYDAVVRENYLRQDLAHDGAGLGHQLAQALLLRRISESADAAWANQSTVTDRWNASHRDHLSSVQLDLSLEITRLRGDVLALREQVSALTVTMNKRFSTVDSSLHRLQKSVGRVKAVVRMSTRPLRQSLGKVAGRVDDLWQTDRGVARLVKHRDQSR